MKTLTLENLRSALIRQEETIIFALIERAQFKHNPPVYTPGGVDLPSFDGTFSDFLLWETEKVHARVRRYTSPDEHPFFADLPEPILPRFEVKSQIKHTAINVNDSIRRIYLEEILPTICQAGDDENYGSSAVCDVACLQALSKRIHYGKFVAEVKFQAEKERYTHLIQAGDSEGIMQALTNQTVEDRLLIRVAAKAETYGQEIGTSAVHQIYKVQPKVVANLYRDWIIPLTKEVEVAYLLERLDSP